MLCILDEEEKMLRSDLDAYLRTTTRSMAVLRTDAFRQGRRLVVPTLLIWLGSAVVHDIKGENWVDCRLARARRSRLRSAPRTPAAARSQAATRGCTRRAALLPATGP